MPRAHTAWIAEWIGIVVLGVLFSGCASRYYALPPFEDITEVDVNGESSQSARITDRKRVAAIAAFLNERRDKWFDPEYRVFSVPGGLNLLDPHGHRVASIAEADGTGARFAEIGDCVESPNAARTSYCA
jgi:hypothetical protein